MLYPNTAPTQGDEMRDLLAKLLQVFNTGPVGSVTSSGATFTAYGLKGENGSVNEIGTNAVTGINCDTIQCLTDTVFSSLTDSLATGDAITGLTITAGQCIYGRFTAFTLTSGAVRAYNR